MLEAALRYLGYGLCHQLPERSYFAGGFQVPVCARDTGIYMGFAVSIAVIALLSRGRRPSSMPPIAVSILAVSFLGLMLFDGVSSYAGWRSTTNDLRLLTGLLAGYALSVFTVPMVNGQLWRRPGSGKVLGSLADSAMWLATLPLAFVLVRWVLPLTGVLFPLLAAAAIIVTFCAVNLVIAALLPPFENKASRLRDAWGALLAAAVMTGFEIYGSALLRGVLDRLASGL